jgi:IS30 family transposase
VRRYRQLSQEERYSIAALGESHKTNAEIARSIGRPACTVQRERRRNSCNSDGAYRAAVAQSYSTARRWRERIGFRHTPQQWEHVVGLLEQDWSPEQISNTLRLAGSVEISHQTIYKFVHNDKRDGGTLFKHLRCSPKLRRKRHNSSDSRGILPGKRHISERPAVVETRTQLGHWEADTVMGSDLHHGLLTMVERKSGLAVIKKLESRTTAAVTRAALSVLEEHKASTITFDNGTEFHGYKLLEERFPVKCYFATPYHSWERGSNENLNGLIRQYFPKGTSMRSVTQADCNKAAVKLNSRPRKRHCFQTPQYVYDHDAKKCTSTLNLSRPRIRSNSLRMQTTIPDPSRLTRLLFSTRHNPFRKTVFGIYAATPRETMSTL